MIARKMTPTEEWAANVERDFLAAYEANADMLFRHCLLRVRDRDRAKDIVQETFSRTWVYLSEGKKIDYIKAFLFRVANNLIVDGSRRQKSSSLDAMMDEDGFEVVDTDSTDPTERQGIRDALRLLDTLDEIYKVAITMRFMDEMSPGKIAKVLGISENAVSVRIHRGIDQLQKLYNKPPAPKDAQN
jgi:RNA polymerase sigma factor (sigma-70 family)